MTETSTAAIGLFDEKVDRRVMARMGIIGIAIAAAAVIGVVLVILWANDQRERDLRVWQDRMGIVAASRAEAVANWAGTQKRAIGALADNDAVRLYVGELLDPSAPEDDELAAEGQYLENLLVVTAEREGFTAPVRGADVSANVERRSAAGLALLNVENEVIVSTPATPLPPDDVRAFLRTALGGSEVVLSRMYAGEQDDTPSIAIAAPIPAIQEDTVIGGIVGVKPVAGELFPLLEQPGATEKTAEAVLVGRRDATIVYMSPLADGSSALARTIAVDTPDLAAGFALGDTGGFATRRDYRDIEVLVTSRAIAGTDWILMYKIDRDEALADSDARLTRTLAFLIFIVVIVTAGALAIWRHGTSQRAAQAANLFRELAERFEHQANFIRRLTDDEFNQIRDSLREGIELLSTIEFEGPVTETLEQRGERYDGSGQPAGLAGDDILITARIIAVANTFVAMTSARAHRPGIPVDEAVLELMNDTGKAYDRAVVVALANLVENRGGRDRWGPDAKHAEDD